MEAETPGEAAEAAEAAGARDNATPRLIPHDREPGAPRLPLLQTDQEAAAPRPRPFFAAARLRFSSSEDFRLTLCTFTRECLDEVDIRPKFAVALASETADGCSITWLAHEAKPAREFPATGPRRRHYRRSSRGYQHDRS